MRKTIEEAAQELAEREFQRADDLPKVFRYDVEEAVQNAFIAGARFALANQWISVDDALPEEGIYVLVCNNIHGVLDGKTYPYPDLYCRWGYVWRNRFADDFPHPTHWMAIPTPPDPFKKHNDNQDL